MTSELKPEEYYAVHQKAFRTAFDFLTHHFPPEHSTEWWEKAAKDVGEAYIEVGRESLAFHLLSGVYDYLGEEWKRRFSNETGY